MLFGLKKYKQTNKIVAQHFYGLRNKRDFFLFISIAMALIFSLLKIFGTRTHLCVNAQPIL